MVTIKPYFVRAIYQWCCDTGLTPYIRVHVDENTVVPLEHAKENGEIVLNLSLGAVRNLIIHDNEIRFVGRFDGHLSDVIVPMPRLVAVFAKENGKGAFFSVEAAPRSRLHSRVKITAPTRHLALVK